MFWTIMLILWGVVAIGCVGFTLYLVIVAKKYIEEHSLKLKKTSTAEKILSVFKLILLACLPILNIIVLLAYLFTDLDTALQEIIKKSVE